LGKGANVFLASAELAAVSAIEGKLPSVEEYLKYAKEIDSTAKDTFRYLNFDQLSDYTSKANSVDLGVEYKSNLQKEVDKLKSNA
jgi:aconitate hydratase 2/2-methylisocitrate dehydratase